MNIGGSYHICPATIYSLVRPHHRWIYVHYIHRWRGLTDEYMGVGQSQTTAPPPYIHQFRVPMNLFWIKLTSIDEYIVTDEWTPISCSDVAISAKNDHTFFGVRPGDHCMPFIMVPLGQSCILLRFLHSGPLLCQADPRYNHTLPRWSRTRHIPKVP
jgi:hypothetical protein